MKADIKKYGVRCDCCRKWLLKKDHLTIKTFETKGDAHTFMHKKGWNTVKGFDMCPKCYMELMKDDSSPPQICTTECWDCSDLTCTHNTKRRIFSPRMECEIYVGSRKIRLEKISKHPEQYWAYLGDEKIGYIKYKFGIVEVCDAELERDIFELELFKGDEDESHESVLPDSIREAILDMCKMYVYEDYKKNKRKEDDGDTSNEQNREEAIAQEQDADGSGEVCEESKRG